MLYISTGLLLSSQLYPGSLLISDDYANVIYRVAYDIR